MVTAEGGSLTSSHPPFRSRNPAHSVLPSAPAILIIAVLIAIAVPIFVTALDKAETQVMNANERTLKGMAVVEILSEDSLLYKTDETTGVQTLNGTWYAFGKCDKDGKITTEGNWIVTEKPTTGITKTQKTKDGYELFVEITSNDLKLGS